MRSVVRLTLGVAVLFCVASVAQAQPGGGRFGGGGGIGASRLSLLRMEAVQKELGLTEDQVAAVKKLSDELRPMGRPGGRGGNGGGEGRQNGRRRGGDNNPDVRVNGPDRFYVQAEQPRQRGQLTEEQIKQFREQAAERAKKEREELAKILKPDQIKRLTEIFIQQAGVQALGDADVAKELGINDEQKGKLEKVRQEQMTAMREAFAGGGGGDREAARTKFAELRKSNDEKTLAVLTDDQKKKFEEMKGKKFDLPEQPGRGGGGAGARPGNRETN